MGRDVAGLRIDKNANVVNVRSNGAFHGRVHVAPKAIPEGLEPQDPHTEDHTMKDKLSDESNEKQDVQGVKNTNHVPHEKIIRAETQKSTDKKLSSPVKLESVPTHKGTSKSNSFEPVTPSLEVEKQTSHTDQNSGVDSNDSGVKFLPTSNDPGSPDAARRPQPNSPSMSRKLLQPNDKRNYDEEDNWSLASSVHSTATSRTFRNKVTVPVAPRFTCSERLERRKEFYNKLEEKHRALEKEREDYEARTREEEQAAIKQLRKSMAYKANPVPNFYREGPPPRAELKKLPVTRAKSPNLTRRKSCGDAIKVSPNDDKGLCGRTTRHSVGSYKEGNNSPMTPKSKDRTGARKLNGTNKFKDRSHPPKEKIEKSPPKEQESTDIIVES